MRLQAQGLTLEQWLQFSGTDERAVRRRPARGRRPGRQGRPRPAGRRRRRGHRGHRRGPRRRVRRGRRARRAGRRRRCASSSPRPASCPALRADIAKRKALEWLTDTVAIVDEDGNTIASPTSPSTRSRRGAARGGRRARPSRSSSRRRGPRGSPKRSRSSKPRSSDRRGRSKPSKRSKPSSKRTKTEVSQPEGLAGLKISNYIPNPAVLDETNRGETHPGRPLLAAAQGEHHLPGHADRRHRRQPDLRPAAAPRVGEPRQGHQHLHQQPRWRHHRAVRHLRHHAVRQARHHHDLLRPGRLGRRGAARRRHAGQAPGPPARPGPASTSPTPGPRARPPTSSWRPRRSCACAPSSRRSWPSHTGQTVEKIHRDTDRDFVMSAAEAKEYGIIDEVISARELADNSGPIAAVR